MDMHLCVWGGWIHVCVVCVCVCALCVGMRDALERGKKVRSMTNTTGTTGTCLSHCKSIVLVQSL